MFALPNNSQERNGLKVAYSLVNIREQCAWVHANDPRAATDKATALVAAAIANARMSSTGIVKPQSTGRSVVILGSGSAARYCQVALTNQGICTHRVETAPDHVQRTAGQYVVSRDGSSWSGSGLVLVPGDEEEGDRILAAFGPERRRPRVQSERDNLETHLPGVFYCPPGLDPEISGLAVAARVAAWLGRIESRTPVASVVDPARCRACGDCVEICELGAAILVEENKRRTSWIDPAICSGCGVCIAHCPSGAIMSTSSTDAQVEAMLGAILDDSTLILEKGLNGNP